MFIFALKYNLRTTLKYSFSTKRMFNQLGLIRTIMSAMH
jgi:hypothetical protein